MGFGQASAASCRDTRLTHVLDRRGSSCPGSTNVIERKRSEASPAIIHTRVEGVTIGDDMLSSAVTLAA